MISLKFSFFFSFFKFSFVHITKKKKIFACVYISLEKRITITTATAAMTTTELMDEGDYESRQNNSVECVYTFHLWIYIYFYRQQKLKIKLYTVFNIHYKFIWWFKKNVTFSMKSNVIVIPFGFSFRFTSHFMEHCCLVFWFECVSSMQEIQSSGKHESCAFLPDKLHYTLFFSLYKQTALQHFTPF